MTTPDGGEDGFTIVELVISLTVFAIVATSMLGLFATLVNSAFITKRKAVASTLAVNQMEYIKSLPFDSLAVTGGSIVATSYIPATSSKTVNGTQFTITTSINYVDDAFDGCASYPSQALKLLYCRNYPPPSGAPATDTNPEDYKVIHVSVLVSSTKLAEVDTQIAARVAETASTTGAMFVSILDDNGNPVSGVSVNVSNSTLAPVVNLTDSTDSNGVAIFYGLVPDTNAFDYTISASKTGYSSIATIIPNGSLTPTYPSQKVFTQASSYVTLVVRLQGVASLLVETTSTTGTPIANAKVYIKGGYKKYTATTDTSYYYDNLSPSDVRPTTDVSGLSAVSNLVPGTYIFCGDSGATSCSVGGTTYYLAAAVPYSGTNPFNPINVPIYDPASPPATTFPFGGNNYLQKVRLLLTTSSTHPRITKLTPDDASRAAGLTSFAFAIVGNNLPCSATAGSCSTVVKFLQGSNIYTASCTGTSAGLQLNCTVNLSTAVDGSTQLQVIANGFTITMPAAPMIGGISVTP